jgi:hypothetical protein
VIGDSRAAKTPKRYFTGTNFFSNSHSSATNSGLEFWRL